MSPAPKPSKEDVLDAFAVERNQGREMLEEYIRTYPQFAAELVDLSRSIHRALPSDDAPLSEDDEAMIEAALQRHIGAMVAAAPLGRLSTDELRDIARQLNVPRQVIAAFQEHRVILTTVPKRFLGQFAEAARTTVEFLVGTVSQPRSNVLARSFKADQTPQSEGPVNFERLLIDAGLSEEARNRLLSESD
jgi:hypothetical protein